MMKRYLMAMILALCLLGASLAGAEGLLPSLVDTVGMPMPSLGEALGRYPEEGITGVDGGNTEVFQGITETDFNTFSVYLSEKGAALADYLAVGSSFSASIQVEGKTISFSYDTQTLEARVTYPKGTYDEWLDYAKTQYESAIRLLDDGKTDDAISVLLTIPNYNGYWPVSEYLRAHPEFAAAVTRKAKLAPFQTVGGYVTFGSYEQDNNIGNGQEPIEWLVLDYDAVNNRALMISRYGLDAKPYNEKFDDANRRYADITWEKCSLRMWLNGEFLSKAFTSQEQKCILTTKVDNSASQNYYGYVSEGGNNTQDKIFLLSYAEAKQYFDVSFALNRSRGEDNTKAQVEPTEYAIKQGADPNGAWWLRSPGEEQNCAFYINYQGHLIDTRVGNNKCDRPALWINLDSDIF